MFEEALQIFKDNGVNPIVNEMEEVPFVYATPATRPATRQMMDETVAKRVPCVGM